MARHPVACAQRPGLGPQLRLQANAGHPRQVPPVTLRVTFGSEKAARGLWRELHERDYHPELFVRGRDEAWFVVVTTQRELRAEVVGLGWMAGGSVVQVTRHADLAGIRLIG